MRAVLLSLLLVVPAAAGAESVLERRYGSAKLDALWTGTLGAAPPDPAWFAVLAPASAAEPVVEAPESPLGLPFDGVIIGEGAPAPDAAPAGFPVIPLPAEEADALFRRLAWAEIYLSRYRYFEAVSTDGPEVLDTLTGRQSAAAAEAYLITARRYFSAPDLPEKCRHIKRMAEIEAGPLSGASEALLPTEWRPLLPIVTSAAARLGDDTLADLVCSVAPVRGRAETVRMVETGVRERIMTEVRAKVDETLTLLEATGAEFQAMVAAMDVAIPTDAILDLQRRFGNAAANIELVKTDALNAEVTLQALAESDLSSLNQPGQLAEFDHGRAEMDRMIGAIGAVMDAIATIAEASNDPEVRSRLAPCAALDGLYATIDVSEDSGAIAARIEGPYTDCLSRAEGLVGQFQEPSLDKMFMAALAHELRRLSETFLQEVSP